MADRVTAAQFIDNDLPDWQVVAGAAETAFRGDSFADAGRLAADIAALCDEHQHHASLDVRYPATLFVRTTTHSAGGLTDLDVDLARAISALAAERGFAPQPLLGENVDIAIDAMEIATIRPFWRAVLGYGSEDVRFDDPALVDASGRGPTVWFQQMDEPRPQRNRIHLDINVPPEVAEQRVADTIAAGGVLITDESAPSFWVLGDPEGNEACVCTWQAQPGRSGVETVA